MVVCSFSGYCFLTQTDDTFNKLCDLPDSHVQNTLLTCAQDEQKWECGPHVDIHAVGYRALIKPFLKSWTAVGHMIFQLTQGSLFRNEPKIRLKTCASYSTVKWIVMGNKQKEGCDSISSLVKFAVEFLP